MYVTGGKSDDVAMITQEDVMVCEQLVSNQEEADTRIILHAITAAESGVNVIVINSPDTDVMVLLLHHRTSIRANEIYFMTGRQGKYIKLTRFIPIHVIFNMLSCMVVRLLLSVYCLTGCDTVSVFLWLGEEQAFKIIMKDPDRFSQLASLGDSFPLKKEEKVAVTRFVCSLYGDNKCANLNELRCKWLTRGCLLLNYHRRKIVFPFILKDVYIKCTYGSNRQFQVLNSLHQHYMATRKTKMAF